MAPTEGRVARPERRRGCRRGTPRRQTDTQKQIAKQETSTFMYSYDDLVWILLSHITS